MGSERSLLVSRYLACSLRRRKGGLGPTDSSLASTGVPLTSTVTMTMEARWDVHLAPFSLRFPRRINHYHSYPIISSVSLSPSFLVLFPHAVDQRGTSV